MRIIRGAYGAPKWKIARAELLWFGRKPCGIAVGLFSRSRHYVAVVPRVKYGQ